MDNPVAENIMGTLGAVRSLLHTFIYPTDLANNDYLQVCWSIQVHT
jgi:hypothetical protein